MPNRGRVDKTRQDKRAYVTQALWRLRRPQSATDIAHAPIAAQPERFHAHRAALTGSECPPTVCPRLSSPVPSFAPQAMSPSAAASASLCSLAVASASARSRCTGPGCFCGCVFRARSCCCAVLMHPPRLRGRGSAPGAAERRFAGAQGWAPGCQRSSDAASRGADGGGMSQGRAWLGSGGGALQDVLSSHLAWSRAVPPCRCCCCCCCCMPLLHATVAAAHPRGPASARIAVRAQPFRRPPRLWRALGCNSASTFLRRPIARAGKRWELAGVALPQ
jgi:hypothetical protein